MEGQEVVNETPAEQTVVTDPTTVEATQAPSESQETTEIDETPSADTKVEPSKVSESVPYDRFKEVNEEVKALKEQLAQLQPAQPQTQIEEPVAEFDPDVTNAVRRLASQEAQAMLAKQRVTEFQVKHAADLEKDPLLRAAVDAEMRAQAAKGEMIMPEKAYENAQKLLDERLNKKVEKAKEEGVKEGQDIAKTKQQLGAVGETGKIPEKSDDQLSAAELAQKYNIPRA